jgi:transcriptional regulator GlxA family with amidase domain
MGPHHVVIALFPDVDLLDVGGPYEVFLTAGRLAQRDGASPPFAVTTAGSGPVRAYGGLGLSSAAALDEVAEVDVLVVPGAIDLAPIRADRALLDALGRAAARAQVVASVCTGAFLLADLGLLPPRWTTHWEDVADLAAQAGPGGDGTVRWVDEGRVVTGGALSSGIAMALHLVDRLAGRELAVRTARQIDYAWDPADARRPALEARA